MGVAEMVQVQSLSRAPKQMLDRLAHPAVMRVGCVVFPAPSAQLHELRSATPHEIG